MTAFASRRPSPGRVEYSIAIAREMVDRSPAAAHLAGEIGEHAAHSASPRRREEAARFFQGVMTPKTATRVLEQAPFAGVVASLLQPGSTSATRRIALDLGKSFLPDSIFKSVKDDPRLFLGAPPSKRGLSIHA